jgi:hypothetical protein
VLRSTRSSHRWATLGRHFLLRGRGLGADPEHDGAERGQSLMVAAEIAACAVEARAPGIRSQSGGGWESGWLARGKQ